MRLLTTSDYAAFWQILTEAEHRAAVYGQTEAGKNSAETVALCNERMRAEGLTREDLQRAARKGAR